MKDPVFEALLEAARAKEAVALGIISAVKGSSPQKLGARALFYADGRIRGTLGGGCLEAEVQKRAIQSLRTGQAARFDLLLDHDFGWDDGLICGGRVEGVIIPNAHTVGEKFWAQLTERTQPLHWGVREDFSLHCEPVAEQLVGSGAVASRGGGAGTRALKSSDWLYRETLTPACALWIAGAGHIAQAVAPLAAQLDFAVSVFDDRPALVNHQVFPEAVKLQSDSWEKLLQAPWPQVPSFALIVTRGHRHDALVLQNWIHKPFLFLGMIGSARKARIIFEHFREEGLATPEELERVACPVGVRIHSQTVMEIAVSIMAQFIAKRAELVRHVLPESAHL